MCGFVHGTTAIFKRRDEMQKDGNNIAITLDGGKSGTTINTEG